MIKMEAKLKVYFENDEIIMSDVEVVPSSRKARKININFRSQLLIVMTCRVRPWLVI